MSMALYNPKKKSWIHSDQACSLVYATFQISTRYVVRHFNTPLFSISMQLHATQSYHCSFGAPVIHAIGVAQKLNITPAFVFIIREYYFQRLMRRMWTWMLHSACMLGLPTPDGPHMVCLPRGTATPNLLVPAMSSWSSTMASSQTMRSAYFVRVLLCNTVLVYCMFCSI